MKKRAVTLVLSMVLALSVVGCGSNSEPTQEEAQAEEQEVVQEQEENKADTGAGQEEKDVYELSGKDYGSFFLFDDEQKTDLDFDIESCVVFQNGPIDYTFSKNTLIYDSGSGWLVGYAKEGETVSFVNASSEIARFVENTDKRENVSFVVLMKDIDSPNDIVAAISDNNSETEDVKETVDPYDEILEMAGYDKDKTYTCDEYVEIVIKIAEEMGKTYNPDLLNVVKENGGKGEGFYIDQPSATFDFTDHEKTLENTKWIMAYFEMGRSGAENITEVYIQKIDENNVGIPLKSEF